MELGVSKLAHNKSPSQAILCMSMCVFGSAGLPRSQIILWNISFYISYFILFLFYFSSKIKRRMKLPGRLPVTIGGVHSNLPKRDRNYSTNLIYRALCRNDRLILYRLHGLVVKPNIIHMAVTRNTYIQYNSTTALHVVEFVGPKLDREMEKQYDDRIADRPLKLQALGPATRVLQ